MSASLPVSVGVLRRPALLLLGVLVLQLAFIASYVAAFHRPTPHAVPIGVVAPVGATPGTAQRVADTLSGLPGRPLAAHVVDDAAFAAVQVRDRALAAYLAVGDSTAEHLYVAGAEGSAEAEAVERVLHAYLARAGRSLVTTDLVPAQDGDARGLSSFYLAVGWTVGGYLAAAVLGLSAGARPLTRSRAGLRLVGLGVYACCAGLTGALIVGPWLGALTGHVLALAAFGALLVFAVGMATAALQTWLGLVGIGVAIAIFVIIGNPSAGGAYPGPLLPSFWAHTGPWLPPGAATSGIRGIVYFGNAGTTLAALTLVAWAVVGGGLTLLGSPSAVRAQEPAVPGPRVLM